MPAQADSRSVTPDGRVQCISITAKSDTRCKNFLPAEKSARGLFRCWQHEKVYQAQQELEETVPDETPVEAQRKGKESKKQAEKTQRKNDRVHLEETEEPEEVHLHRQQDDNRDADEQKRAEDRLRLQGISRKEHHAQWEQHAQEEQARQRLEEERQLWRNERARLEAYLRRESSVEPTESSGTSDEPITPKTADRPFINPSKGPTSRDILDEPTTPTAATVRPFADTPAGPTSGARRTVHLDTAPSNADHATGLNGITNKQTGQTRTARLDNAPNTADRTTNQAPRKAADLATSLNGIITKQTGPPPPLPTNPISHPPESKPPHQRSKTPRLFTGLLTPSPTAPKPARLDPNHYAFRGPTYPNRRASLASKLLGKKSIRAEICDK
ncbi:hypothetical protein MMC08_000094, partial [Hypocenomyce scalaris]|nr:hypothetical protein [Hypocenomyce scalaris]